MRACTRLASGKPLLGPLHGSGSFASDDRKKEKTCDIGKMNYGGLASNSNSPREIRILVNACNTPSLHQRNVPFFKYTPLLILTPAQAVFFAVSAKRRPMLTRAAQCEDWKL